MLDVTALGSAVQGTPSATAGKIMSFSTSTFTDNNTAASGTAAGYVVNSMAAGKLKATNASVTTTNAIQFYVGGAPLASTNETFTNTTAVYVASNAVTGTNSYGLQVNAPTGATNNYAGVFNGGGVGIGTTAPVATLDVAGQIHSQVFNAGSSTTINWNNGNVQYTSANCSGVDTQFTFSNMLEGGSYTLVVTGASPTGSCNFTCNGSGSCNAQFTAVTPTGVTGWTFYPPNATPTATSIYTMVRVGNIIYVSWISGFGAAQ
jgi:hypothetical protein